MIRSRPFLAGLLGVGIVDALGDPEPAAVVPGHAERLDDLRLGREQLRLEAVRDDHVLRSTPPARAGFCILWIGSPCVPHCLPGE